MEECKAVVTSLLEQIEGHHLDDNAISERPYRQIAGSLTYATICSRRELCFVSGQVSQYMTLTQELFGLVPNGFFVTLEGSRQCQLFPPIKLQKSVWPIGVWDSEWARSIEDKCSRSGFLLLGAKGVVLLKCERQPVLKTSTGEARYLVGALPYKIQFGWTESTFSKKLSAPYLVINVEICA